MTQISRRGVLAGAAGGLALGVFASVGAAEQALAAGQGWRWPDGSGLSRDVHWLTGLETTAYVSYMHMNGFFGRDSRYFVYRVAPALGAANLLHVYDTVRARSVAVPTRRAGVQMVGGFLDVSRETGMVLNAESVSQADETDGTVPRIWAYDVAELMRSGSSEWTPLYQVEGPGVSFADTSAAINNAGTKIALAEHYGIPDNPALPSDRLSRIVVADIATGAHEVLVDRPVTHNHVHFSPHDDDWVVFSREGDSTQHKERVWAHHPVHAPAGANVMPQVLDSGQVLRLSHERAAWHAPELIAVNYENPRGLWRGFLDGREPELIALGRFEHCDISRDGRFAVVDTDDGRPKTSITVIDTLGEFPATVVAAGTHRGVSHPRHNHPVFSPDGRHVLFNDTDPANTETGGLRIGVVDLAAWGYPV